MKKILAYIAMFLMVSAYAVESEESSVAKAKLKLDELTVYKTPHCGCCGEWVDHIEKFGFQAQVVSKPSLADLKTSLGVPENARSCHTATHSTGFIFEGHIPAKYITSFLAAPPPGAKGLIVPAMPVGSPGMEYKNQFNPYKIFLLKADGKLEEFASVESYESQF